MAGAKTHDGRMGTADQQTSENGSSPAGRGGAGPYLEGEIGAFYLLALLARAEARGLPGSRIECVRFQGVTEGFALDDIVVHANIAAGEALLEIQSKRTIKFSPKDALFEQVCAQIARSLSNTTVAAERYQLAVATARTSYRISGPYQEVLGWARALDTSGAFFGRLGAAGVASADMREFVDTFRKNLAAAGVADDDETLWQILRRFQILEFDFEASAPLARIYALDRARQVLDPADGAKAGALWRCLVDIALETAKAGGVLDFETVRLKVVTLDFRLAGDRNYAIGRAKVDEMARHALAGIGETVANVQLPRTAAMMTLADARDNHRYIEIGGGPGVGKSAILAGLARSVLTESPAIILDPLRTPAGGWTQLAAALGITATAHDFLSDLACSGGAVLFIDSIEMFTDPGRRATVNDILREVARIEGFAVIVTARSDFDADEPNWLAKDAREKLGDPARIAVGDLGEDEIAFLVASAPELRALLAPGHPAAPIARNLYRLSRLLAVEDSSAILRSEAALAHHWWTKGDGLADDHLRDRQRILAALADAALAGADTIALGASSIARTQLRGSEALREPRRDTIAFYHDVLRDWAVGERLHETPELCGGLPLERPVPANLGRGIEMAARLAIELDETAERWRALMEQLSRPSAHASWRRYALLAIVRSERAASLLEAASPALLAMGGTLLVELADAVVAVETVSMADLLQSAAKASGRAVPTVHRSLRAAITPATPRILVWCVDHADQIPVQAIGAILKLITVFLVAPLPTITISQRVLAMLHRWLMRFEGHDADGGVPADPEAEPLSSAQSMRLVEDVREIFLSFSERAPTEARSYLVAIAGERNNHHKIKEIRRFSQPLAKVAPEELALLVERGLTEELKKPADRYERRDNTFGYVDLDYMPPSPAQGPFLDLLTAAPHIGLGLRRLVQHSVDFHAGKKAPGENGYWLLLDEGARFFPWRETYLWSRHQSRDYCVASALMALEAWGHARLDAGEDPKQVLVDILGPEGACAAYAMVAVDLILSHWPKTRQVAVPFVACPELLTDDRTRHAHEEMGLNGLSFSKEPHGTVRIDDLRQRASRNTPLERALPQFLRADPEGNAVRDKLQQAIVRLGDFAETADFGDAAFMARYAANVTDIANYVEDGTLKRYQSPEAEQIHLNRLQRERGDIVRTSNLEAGLQLATGDRARGSADLARAAIDYAAGGLPDDSDVDHLRSRSTRLVTTAMLAARDGDDTLLAEHESWVREVIDRALAEPIDSAHGRHDRLDFNRQGQAANGLAHLWLRQRRDADRERLLAVAAAKDPSAAPGIAAALAELGAADARLPKAILRCALATRVSSWDRYDGDSGRLENLENEYLLRQAAAIEAETNWLDGGAEPAWPTFPELRLVIRRGTRIRVPATDAFEDEFDAPARFEEPVNSASLDYHAAAAWLGAIAGTGGGETDAWLPGLIDAYTSWTARANGAGLAAPTELDRTPDDWNYRFYPLAARFLLDRPEDIFSAFLAELNALPDHPFCDVAPILLHAVDVGFFNNPARGDDRGERVRGSLAERTRSMSRWGREPRRGDLSVERHFGPLVGTLFMNNHNAFATTVTYLVPAVFDRVDTMLDTLRPLLRGGPVPFIALCTMNTLEVLPRARHADFFLSAVGQWFDRMPRDRALWFELGIGRRAVGWLIAAAEDDPTLLASGGPQRASIEAVLGRLAALGVPEAHELEQRLLAGAPVCVDL
jgi:hypothetical protein